MRKIVKNAIQCNLCGDIIESTYRHEYVECKCGAWLHFDYVPGEGDVRKGSAAITGRLCVIGSKLNHEALCELFGVDLK